MIWCVFVNAFCHVSVHDIPRTAWYSYRTFDEVLLFEERRSLPSRGSPYVGYTTAQLRDGMWMGANCKITSNTYQSGQTKANFPPGILFRAKNKQNTNVIGRWNWWWRQRLSSANQLASFSVRAENFAWWKTGLRRYVRVFPRHIVLDQFSNSSYKPLSIDIIENSSNRYLSMSFDDRHVVSVVFLWNGNGKSTSNFMCGHLITSSWSPTSPFSLSFSCWTSIATDEAFA